MREITKKELMAEVVKNFGNLNLEATPETIRAYANRMVRIYEAYDLCPVEIFRGIEGSYFITVYTKK